MSGKRYSELTPTDADDISGDDIIHLTLMQTPPLTAVVTVDEARELLAEPGTDHTGSVGAVDKRWSSVHTDTLSLYGGAAPATVSTPLQTLSQSWNAIAVAFTAIYLAITDTASAVASLLVDLKVNGTSVFKVRKDGQVTATAFVGPLTGAVTGDTAGTHTGAVVGNVTGNVTGAVTGNATTASAVAAANLTGATLAAGVTASSLTSLGTIADLTATKAHTGRYGPTSINTATPTVIIAATVPAGAYLVWAFYTANSVAWLVTSDGAGNVVVGAAAAAGSGLTLDVSGGAVRVAQASGSAQTVSAAWVRIS